MFRQEQLDILTAASIHNQREKEYWLTIMAGELPHSSLPAAHNTDPKATTCHHYEFSIGDKLHQRLQLLSNDSDYSLQVILMAALQVMLSKYTDNADVITGTPIYRQTELSADQLINTVLAIRGTIEGNATFASLLEAMGQQMVLAMQHQNYPIEVLQQELADSLVPGAEGLFSVALLLDNIQELHYLDSVQPDITFVFTSTDSSLKGQLIYKTGRYDDAVAARLAHHYCTLLQYLVTHVEQPLYLADMMPPEEATLIHQQFNATSREYNNAAQCLAQLMEAQVQRDPTRIAVTWPDGVYTYEMLNRKANQLGNVLRTAGAGPNQVVGVLAERSPEMLTAILGTMKSGAAYLPIDPSYPAERIQFMVEDSGCKYLMVQSHLTVPPISTGVTIFNLNDPGLYTGSGEDLPWVNKPADLAYVIYTSGSTGNPKGVMIEQHSLVNRLNWMHDRYRLTGTDVILQKTPFTFDVSVWELFWWLFTGAGVYLLAPGTEKYPDQMVAEIKANNVTVMHFVPSMLVVFLEYVSATGCAAALASLRQVFTSGEALSAAAVKEFSRLLPGCALSNLYGPTEATIDVSYFDCPATGVPDSIPIGKPIDNIQLYITNRHQQLQPIGVAGELCIGGVGLARGYLNRRELTAERFITVPWHDTPVYRTGDLARWLPDGNIAYLGRIDNQVKIRGYRIELGEIEQQLLKLDTVRDALVLVQQREQDKYLRAFVVPAAPCTEHTIKEALGQVLPVYMVPAYITLLDTLPLTPNGKADRKALQRMPLFVETAAQHWDDPREQMVADIWKEVLKTVAANAADNFFYHGGDSILAIRLVSKVNTQLQANIDLAAFYEVQTLGGLITLATATDTRAATAEKTAALEEIHTFESQYLVGISAEGKQNIDRVYPMSDIEKGMCYHHLKDPALNVYYEQNTLDFLFSDIDIELIVRALKLMIAKHPALRTAFDLNRLAHVVYKEIPLPLQVEDLMDKDRDTQQQVIGQFLKESKLKAFPLASVPLWRITMFRINAGHLVFTMEAHHAIFDGWSWASFMTEFSNVYFRLKEDPGFAPLPLKCTFEDYILEELLCKRNKAITTFWKNELEGYQRLQLNGSKESPEYLKMFRTFDSQYLHGLQQVAEQYQVQVKHLLFAAYVYATKMLTYENDIVTGLVAFSRPLVEDGERLLGCFLNTVPVRIQVPAGLSWREYLAAVEEKLALIRKYDQLPLLSIVEQTREQYSGGNPLFDAQFNFVNFHVWKEINDNTTVGGTGVPFRFESYLRENTLFDFNVDLTDGNLNIAIEYFTAYISTPALQQLLSCFEKALYHLQCTPDEKIDPLLLIAGDVQQIREVFNTTVKPYEQANNTLAQLMEAQVRQHPSRIAVSWSGGAYTYEELNTRANQLGAMLRALGAGPDQVVGILAERSPEMLVAILAVVKSGAAYLPIDPAYPADRIQFMLEDSGCSYLLKQQQFPTPGIEGNITVLNINNAALYKGVGADLPLVNTPADLAYIIYTSGSTGKPKGVMIEQHALVNRLCWMQSKYPLNSTDKILQKTPFTFDVSVWELFWWLFTGAGVHLLSAGAEKFPDQIVEEIAANEVTVMHFVPSMLTAFLDYVAGAGCEASLQSLRQVFASGEALSASAVKAFNRLLPGCALSNLYGPTEATIDVSYYDCPKTDVPDNIPIGKPIDNLQLYITDRYQQLQPIGVPGELCIGGKGLARGYLNRPTLTAERFVRVPWSDSSVYRTGDLARWLPDGNIEYLGRIDSQVKIRGYRIELGEIEEVLLQYEDVSQCAVIAKPTAGDALQLHAYIVPQGMFNRERIYEYLKQRLPAYMIPPFLVEMTALPLTGSGKLDRKALPEMEARSQSRQQPARPRNSIELQLQTIWKELLGVAEIGIHDNIFEWGGHSLMAMRAIGAINTATGANAVIRDVFAHTTIAQFAALLEEKGVVALPLAPTFLRKGPLSFSQERLWFIDSLQGSVHYHMPVVVKMEGPLNVQALQQALESLIERHEILRTVIREEGDQVFQLLRETGGWTMQYTDDASLKDKTLLEAHLEEQIRQPFDLSADYMLRAELIRLAPDIHILLTVTHHIATDGWSLSLMIKELMELYVAAEENRSPRLPVLPWQYADYAEWQRAHLQGDALATQLNYWVGKLKGVSPLDFPTDRVRPAVERMHGSIVHHNISLEHATQLKALSRKEGVTLFMTLLAAFKVLLYRYSGQEDICVGIPIANRTREEVEKMVGFFVNTLALRSDLGGKPSFSEFLQQVRETTLDAYTYQEVPFERIVELVGAARDMTRSPLFQVMFVFQNTPATEVMNFGNISVSQANYEPETAKFDFSFEVTEVAAGLRVNIEFKTDLFNASTIQRMAAHYEQLLIAIASDPSQKVNELPLMTKGEERHQLAGFNNTTVPYPADTTVVHLFEEQVARTPGKIAVTYGEQSLTFRELHQQSAALAAFLQTKGVSRGEMIALCLNRSLEMIIGIWGILKAGCAYVPIDPAYPADRISYILTDTDTRLILTDESSASRIPMAENLEQVLLDTHWPVIRDTPPVDTDSYPQPHDLVYVIYTSGSTGKPKGVMIEHHSLVNRLTWGQQQYPLHTTDVIIQKTPFTFDVSVYELFCWSFTGAQLYLLKQGEEKYSDRIVEVMINEKVTIMHFVPSMLTPFLEYIQESPELQQLKGLRQVFTSGEALSAAAARQFKQLLPWCALSNLYGPTEATIEVSYYNCPDDNIPDNIPIGRPINNTRLYIVDAWGKLQPVGIAGELCIAGVGLARGYRNRDDLTAEKFVSAAWTDERIYRTGDLARWLPNGNIEYLGRIDDQVKIRGYRIELGEIENVLLQHPAVSQAVVIARADHSGVKRLQAYVICRAPFDKSDILAFIGKHVPVYMVPDILLELPDFPLTTSGKVNKKELPDSDNTGIQSVYVAPRNTTDQQLAAIWQELLRLPQVSIQDNFFRLGGHSLMAMRVMAAIRKDMGVALSIKDLFTYTTITALSDYISNRGTSSPVPAIAPVAVSARPARIPLSFSQERLWFIDRLEGSIHYHIPGVLELNGTLDKEALEYAFREVVNRHEVLRTVLREEDGRPYQEVMPENRWKMIYREDPSMTDQQRWQAHVVNSIQQPFDLATDHMLRIELVKLSDVKHKMILVIHHIAADGWSVSILTRELSEYYHAWLEQRAPVLDALPLQYGDYATWQRGYLQGEVLEQQLKYWKDTLTGIPLLQLPADFERPAIETMKGGVIHYRVDETVCAQLKDLAQREGVTLFMLLIAALKVLLFRYSRQEDICIGVPVANRMEKELEPLIGFFVNTLALRSRFRGQQSFAELLQQVKQTTLDAYAHQDVPFEKIVESVGVERSMNHSPLFQVMFVLQNTPEIMESRLGEAVIRPEEFNRTTSKFDLTFDITEMQNGLSLLVEYNSDVYAAASMERLGAHYCQLLKAIAESIQPSLQELAVASEEELATVADFSQGPATPPPATTVLDTLAQLALTYGAVTAVVAGSEQYSFAALETWSGQLARRLQQAGVRPADVVGISMTASPQQLIALLAIWKSGATAVPLNADTPPEYWRNVVKQTGAQWLLTDRDITRLPAGLLTVIDIRGQAADMPDVGKDLSLSLNSTAYTSYTTGADGLPLGFTVSHAQLGSRLEQAGKAYLGEGMGTTATVAHEGLGFDKWLTVVLASLLAGKKVVMLAQTLPEMLDNPDLLKYAPYDFIALPSSALPLVAELAAVWKLTDKYVTSGRPLQRAHLAELAAVNERCIIVNEYNAPGAAIGCIATSICITDAVSQPGNSIRLGRPQNNVTALVWDTLGRPVPPGMPGELCIASNATPYHTGDLVRWDQEGNLEYLGRLDNVIEINDHLVNPAAAHHLLLRYAGVQDALVAVKPGTEGTLQLQAWVVANSGFTPYDAMQWLSEYLPAQWLPAQITLIEALPVLTTGRLQEGHLSDNGQPKGDDTPATPTEIILAAIWQEVLKVERIGLYDNFFEKGGDSLVTVKILNQARKKGIVFRIRDIFMHQTVASLAAFIDASVATPQS
ncbi:amino acid adenylation domain-containing protein [Chitinophaga polysaccharea]|uniref:Amino acid adenylation domain-containing protein n=1 Tax=Chitinophaga polysaccharea TaxID=1293035 RepID=A0A561PWL4_9BACT|nr:non-ribosomal peptide synthetase [Chitinophaga polysaccharea]TWF42514.1 amino acid adenylation domain-containing protein [Chitinophaga polysaccharea]